ALLANQRGAGVGGTINMREVSFTDGAHVTQRVHAEVTVWIGPRLASLDVYSLELEAAHRESRDIFIRHAQSHGHAVECAPRADCLLQLINFFSADQIELDQSIERLLNIGNLFGNQLQLVRGLPARDNFTVSVQDEPACGRYRLCSNTISL